MRNAMMEAQAVTMSRMSVVQHPFPMQFSALPRVTPMSALKSVLTMSFASSFVKPNHVIASSYALMNGIFFAFYSTSGGVWKHENNITASLGQFRYALPYASGT